ncbi:MAG: hypothetical protein J0I28_12190 [Caulobacterales bacterium]|nr:hypothetical protein [Caulobacterales bacterium]
MKSVLIAAALAVSVAGVAMAQAPAPAPAAAPAAGKPSVKTTKINDIIKMPAYKAAMEKLLPEISQYYDQIGDMTLTEVIPMSGGALSEAQVAAVQAEFDKI